MCYSAQVVQIVRKLYRNGSHQVFRDFLVEHLGAMLCERLSINDLAQLQAYLKDHEKVTFEDVRIIASLLSVATDEVFAALTS